jgi:hypothetical protein
MHRSRLYIPDYDYSQTAEEILIKSDRNFDYARYIQDWVKPYSYYRLLINSNNSNNPTTYDLIECRPPLPNSSLNNRNLCLNIYYDSRDESKYPRTSQPMVFNCEAIDHNGIKGIKNISVRIYFDLEKLLAEKFNDEVVNINAKMRTESSPPLPSSPKQPKIEDSEKTHVVEYPNRSVLIDNSFQSSAQPTTTTNSYSSMANPPRY